jgi:AcrR family transcriptional regulator
LSKDDPIGGGPEFTPPPLPRGRHHLGAERVAENQRQRLIAAMAHSVAVRGYAATTVERVLESSGVSRGTFYEIFANRHECLLAAHDAALDCLTSRVSAACEGGGDWERGVRAAIYASVDFAEQRPDQARLLTLDTLAADGQASDRGLAAIDRFAGMLRKGREEHPQAKALPEITERAMVGSVSMMISSRLLRGESLADVGPQLVYLVLVPYVGPTAASRLSESRKGGEFPAPGA